MDFDSRLAVWLSEFDSEAQRGTPSATASNRNRNPNPNPGANAANTTTTAASAANASATATAANASDPTANVAIGRASPTATAAAAATAMTRPGAAATTTPNRNHDSPRFTAPALAPSPYPGVTALDPEMRPLSAWPPPVTLGEQLPLPTLGYLTTALTPMVPAPPPPQPQSPTQRPLYGDGAHGLVGLQLGSRMRSVPLRERGKCQICDSTALLQVTIRDATTESFHTRSCSHYFCSECLEHYIRVKIDEGTRKIACPAADCQRTLTVADVKRLAPSHAGRYQKLLTTDYTARAERDGTELKGIARECPSCHVMVAKDGGCSQVSCPCGVNFCFVCGEERPVCACRRVHRAHRGLGEALHFTEVHTTISRRAAFIQDVRAAQRQVRELKKTFCDRMRERGVTESDVRSYEMLTSREAHQLSRIGQHVHRMRDMHARNWRGHAVPTLPPHAWELANLLEKCRKHATRAVDREHAALQRQASPVAVASTPDVATDGSDQLPAKRARTTTTASTRSTTPPTTTAAAAGGGGAGGATAATTHAPSFAASSSFPATLGASETSVGGLPVSPLPAAPLPSSSSVSRAGRRRARPDTKQCSDTRNKFDALVKDKGKSEDPCAVLSHLLGPDAEWPTLSDAPSSVTAALSFDGADVDDVDDGYGADRDGDTAASASDRLSFAVGPAAWATPTLHHAEVPMTWVVSRPTSDLLHTLRNLAVQCLEAEQTLVEGAGPAGRVARQRDGPQARSRREEMDDARRQLRDLRAKEADIRMQLESEGRRHRLLLPPELVEPSEPTVFDEHMELLLHMKRDVDTARQNLRNARQSLLHADGHLVEVLRRHIRDRQRLMASGEEEAEGSQAPPGVAPVDSLAALNALLTMRSTERRHAGPEVEASSNRASTGDTPSHVTAAPSLSRGPTTRSRSRTAKRRASREAPVTLSYRERAARRAEDGRRERVARMAEDRRRRLEREWEQERGRSRGDNFWQRRQLRVEARRRDWRSRTRRRDAFGRITRQGAITLQHAEQLLEVVERELAELRRVDEEQRDLELNRSLPRFWW